MNRIQSEGSNWTCIAAYCLFAVGLRLPIVVSATTQAARLRGIDGVEVQTTEVDVMRTLLEIDPTERDRSRGLTAHFESGEQRSRRHKIETFNEIDIVSQRLVASRSGWSTSCNANFPCPSAYACASS